METKLKRRIFLTLAAAACSLVLFGCGKPAEQTQDASSKPGEQPTSSKTKPVIGISLLSLANPFFKTMADAMKVEADKHGYEIVVTAGEFDPTRQKDQVNDFIVKKVNAIILSPCDSRSIGTSIQEANKAGIPVFTSDMPAWIEPLK